MSLQWSKPRWIMRHFFLAVLVLLGVVILPGCDSSDVDALTDVVEGVPRKDIDKGLLGINAFANEGRFGTPSQQFSEVKNVLGLSRVRLLYAWNDAVQPSPRAKPDLSFFEYILDGLPADMRAIVVLTDVPAWLGDPSTWISGNPRRNFTEGFLRAFLRRFGSDPRIEGFQIWNEPNDPNRDDNIVLGLVDQPSNYVELLALGYQEVKQRAPGKLVLSGPTTAINQNYPGTLNYNRDMRELGAEEFCDVWSIHFYGRQYENVRRSGGVASFLNGLERPVWITESGEQGFNNQLAYGEEVWPFLADNIQTLQRIYIYQFAESRDPDITYGLKNPSAEFPVSDLYVWLREN